MLQNKYYTPSMNGLIFRRKASQFLNVRVDFSVRNEVRIYLETCGSGFIDLLKPNTVYGLKIIEGLFGLKMSD